MSAHAKTSFNIMVAADCLLTLNSRSEQERNGRQEQHSLGLQYGNHGDRGLNTTCHHDVGAADSSSAFEATSGMLARRNIGCCSCLRASFSCCTRSRCINLSRCLSRSLASCTSAASLSCSCCPCHSMLAAPSSPNRPSCCSRV
jgi:hypothetical protein